MTTQNLLLILLAVTLVFGFGVLLVGRRSSARTSPKAVVDEPLVAEVLAPTAPVNRWGKTAVALAGILGGVRSRGGITNETWDDLEEALLKADVGIGVTDALLNDLRQRVKSKEIIDGDALLVALQNEMTARLDRTDRELNFAAVEAGRVNVWLFVGVNGVGKTTTIGKLGAIARAEGHKVMFAACDTFRAAAIEQLNVWGGRIGAKVMSRPTGADASGLAFDAIAEAKADGTDILFIDTAGRLQNKQYLMDELDKIVRVVKKQDLRFEHECSSHSDHLPLATRQCTGSLGGSIGQLRKHLGHIGKAFFKD